MTKTPPSSAMKVNELKEELKRRGLPTTGLKADLLARLQAAETEENKPAKRTKVSSPAKATFDFDSIENVNERIHALLDCLCSLSNEECERALKYCHSSLITFTPSLQASNPHSVALLLLEIDGVECEPPLSKRRERLNQVYFEQTGNLPARNTASALLITADTMSKDFYHKLTGRETTVEDAEVLTKAANHYINPKVHLQAIGVAAAPEYFFTPRNARSFQHLKSRLEFLCKLELLTSAHSTQRPKVFSSSSTTVKTKFYLNQSGSEITVEQTPVLSTTAPLTNRTDVLLATKLAALERINDCGLLFPAQQSPAAASMITGSTSDDVVDLCLTSKFAYVQCINNNNEALLSETVSKLLMRNAKARVLLVSVKQSNKLQRVALQTLKLGKLSPLDVICLDEHIQDFAPTKCMARFEKQRVRALNEYIGEQSEILFPDFRTARASIPLSKDAEDFALFELFSSDSKSCTEYLAQTRCRLVLATCWSAEEAITTSSGAFDYILLDGCTSQLDFIVYSKLARATRSVVCFGAQQCGFPVHKQMTYTSAPTAEFYPGFAPAVQIVQCASVKEEAEFALCVEQFASRLVGYDDIAVCAWTEKQCELVDDLFAKQGLLSPGCLLASTTTQQQSKSELVLMCTGGSTFSQQDFEQTKLRFGDRGLLVFACNATWKPTGLGLQLVLAERMGENFDEDLRKGSLHIVNKPHELKEIISSL